MLLKAGRLDNLGTLTSRRYATGGFREECYRDQVATDEVRVKRINKAIEDLCAALACDDINGKTTAAKIRTSFVQGIPRDIFDAAYERWHDAGRPGDSAHVTLAKVEPPEGAQNNSTAT
ncbi:hypothetical protein [Williamsia sp. M5A3_1d]